MAPSNGTTSTLSKMVVTLFPHHSTLQWQIAMAMAPSNGTTSTTPSPHHSTLQWHPAMAPRPLHSTLEGHPAMHTGMAPSNGTTSTPLLPPTIAHYNGNGTQQWHHVHPPKVGRRPPPRTIPHYNGTLPWHPWHPTTAPCNGRWVPRPIRQSGSSPSPPIGSKNPYSYRYLGK